MRSPSGVPAVAAPSPQSRGFPLGPLAGLGTLAFLAILGAGGAASRPRGWLLGLPPLGTLAFVLVIAGVAWIVTGSGRGSRSLLGLGFLPLAVLACTGWPIPGVAALTGPPLLAVAIAGLGGVVWSAGWRPPRFVFFPLVLLLYSGVSFRVQVQVGPQGDEPHYLMVAESLLRDGDLSLERDYAEGRYQAFVEGPLSPHYRVRGKGGEIFSLHAVGLSVLILPAYVLGGYPAASFFMAFLAALLAREVRELLRELWDEDGPAETVAWIVALSPPLVHYAGLLFTEVPAALLVAVALRRARHARIADGWSGLVLGLALAGLPWLNVRYAPLAVLLALYALWNGASGRQALVAIGPLVGSAVTLALYHHALYGFFDPRLVYGRRPEFSIATLPEGLPGLLLDQEFGLLVYAPVFVLVVPGLLGIWRRDRRLTALVLAGVGVTFLTAGAWHMWRGGFNPPARFLVPVLPLLVVGLSAALRIPPSAGRLLLVGFSVWAGLAGAAEPRLVHRDRDGTAPFWREYSGAEEWTRHLPGYVLGDRGRHELALVWGLALAAAAVSRTRATPGRLAGASLGLLLAAGAASTVSTGRTEGRDAVRLVGRPAVLPAEIGFEAAARGEWEPRVLDWGPLYEPHRHPGGAALGERLRLPAGTYAISVEAEDLSGTPPPSLEVVPERRSSRGDRPAARLRRREPARLLGEFTVGPDDRAVTLRLLGGGPLILRRVVLEAQP